MRYLRRLKGTATKEAGMALTNKDKRALKDALWGQIENIVMGAIEKTGYQHDLEHLDPDEMTKYLQKLVNSL